MENPAARSHMRFPQMTKAIQCLFYGSAANNVRPGDDRWSSVTRWQEVRAEIDRIDRALVKLLAERLTYIEQAGAIKDERDTVRDEARIEDVVAKVVREAEAQGLPRAMTEPLWRLLIEKSIEHEFTVFDAKAKKKSA